MNATQTKTKTLTLTEDQIDMLRDAIDSHVYWQLSDDNYRSNGAVLEPGAEDEETASEIDAFEALDNLLGEAQS